MLWLSDTVFSYLFSELLLALFPSALNAKGTLTCPKIQREANQKFELYTRCWVPFAVQPQEYSITKKV